MIYRIVRWYVKVGDRVKRDQSLAYLTGPVDTELYCHFDGRVVNLMIEAGQEIPPGTTFEGLIAIERETPR